MKYTIAWIGTVALGVLKDGEPWFDFSLEEGQTIPPEFRVGDELTIVNHPAHPAMIAMDMNGGHYEITHIPSGKVLQTMHRAEEYKLR
jgi:hypothetical protein